MAKRNQLTHLKKIQANQLARENRLQEARALYEAVCRTDKLDVEAWIKLSATERRLGHGTEAEASGRHAVNLQPSLAFAHYALAAALDSQGKLEEALASYHRTLQLDPSFALAHYLSGNALHQMGHMDEALISYRKALALQPDFFEARVNLGAALTKLNQLDEAAEVLLQALGLRPDAPEVLANLGSVAERKGQMEEALGLFQRALLVRPDAIEVIVRLAAFLEKLGRLDEAKAQIERGLALTTSHPGLSLAAARVARREGRIQDAAALLEALDVSTLGHGIAGEIQVLLGQLHDRLGDAAKAFPLLVEGNRRLALASRSGEADARHYLESIRSASRYLSSRLVEPTTGETAEAEDAPVFLVGFPRSGTTLLEQILDCHPALQTLEEMPAAAAMERVFLGWVGERVEGLADLDPGQVSELRQAYLAEVRRHVERRPGTALVDKLPLNLVRVPLVWRVFPNARFILALRHPCDVCLSCFMQSFSVNEAMASFSSLESTARTYAAVMRLWQDYARALPLRSHTVRYEDMVTDFESETRALLDFLGVGWDDAVLHHTERARQRSAINTPSYHQVTQPIYQHAKYRWKRYAKELETVMPVLRPWIEHFGYTD